MAAQPTVDTTGAKLYQSCCSLGLHRCCGDGRPAICARASLPSLISQVCTLEKTLQCADPWSLETSGRQYKSTVTCNRLKFLSVELISIFISEVLLVLIVFSLFFFSVLQMQQHRTCRCHYSQVLLLMFVGEMCCFIIQEKKVLNTICLS